MKVDGLHSFMKIFMVEYPDLYDFMFMNNFGRMPINNVLREFIQKNDIKDATVSPMAATRPVVVYELLWNYICANEDLHEWWML